MTDRALRLGRGLAAIAGIAFGAFFLWWAVEIWDNMFQDGYENHPSLYFVLGLFPAAFSAVCFGLTYSAIRGHAERTVLFGAVLLTFVLLVGIARVFG